MLKKIGGKRLFNIAIYGLSIGILAYFCLSKDGLIDVAKNIKSFSRGWLIMAIICAIIDVVLDGSVIYILTKSGAPSFSIRQTIKTCMVGQFYTAVTPFASAGQPMQIYVMSNQGVSPGVASSALMQKFLVFQSTILAFSTLSILYQLQFSRIALTAYEWSFVIIGYFIQALVIAAVLLFSLNQKITHKLLVFIFKVLYKLRLLKNYDDKIEALEKQLSYFHESNRELYKNKKLLIKATVLTAMQLTAIFVITYCIYRSFNFNEFNIANIISTQAFVTMVSALVPLPGGTGAAEGSFWVFFLPFFSETTIKPALILWRLITHYFQILISAPFAKITKNKTQETATAMQPDTQKGSE
jgi:conserved hypothetical protein